MSDLLDDLEARGLVHESTDRDALRTRLAEGPITLYYGCDPTAASLHIGNLIGLVMLRRFQLAGHRPIALAGGATGMVGDPSGRSEERNLLDEATLRGNVAAIKAQIARVLGPSDDWKLVDNIEWSGELRLLDFLRDVGKHVTVNQMLHRESVRVRLESEQGISFTEFSYMLLQANDYLWLREHERCELQVGGSDQWGNILSGVDLIRRVRGEAVHALCWPLLTAPDGTKVGKTAGARIWLDPERTSPYALYQHFIQVDDADVERQLLQFTLLPVEDIRAVRDEHLKAPERRTAQRVLAHEVTGLVHGPAAAQAAQEATAVLFGGDARGASEPALELVAGEVGAVDLSSIDGNDATRTGVGLIPLLVATGLASSNGDARRALEQGAVSVNGERVSLDREVIADDFLHGRYLLLRKGKRNYGVVVRSG